jgi:hypothetical protein
MEEEKGTWFSIQEGATAYTANYCFQQHVRMVRHRLWYARSQDLNPCGFYVRGNLKNKGYSNNPPTQDEIMHIYETIIEVNELKLLPISSRDLMLVQEQK